MSDNPILGTLRGMDRMDEATRQVYLDMGCDPACHICGDKIDVGDEFDVHPLIAAAEVFTAVGLIVSDIKGTTCARCIREKREFPDEERQRMFDRLRGVFRPPKPKPPPSTVPKRARRGCFFLDDGTSF